MLKKLILINDTDTLLSERLIELNNEVNVVVIDNEKTEIEKYDTYNDFLEKYRIINIFGDKVINHSIYIDEYGIWRYEKDNSVYNIVIKNKLYLADTTYNPNMFIYIK